ncbi:MAG: sigma-70 family RNA polymerase sigma factor [Phycisphaerales bacterium]|nr:MAG: sigma-70 family RNA polymerase sigma factor [Phycisphaerales bacterium]
MATPEAGNVTHLLLEFSGGDQDALDELMPLVYGELQTLASRALRRERPDHTLETTALVHEAYLRLIDQRRVQWRHRAHFYAVAAQLMRRILVDHARKHDAEKRGGARDKVALEDAVMATGEQPVDLAALNEALNRLAQFDPQQNRIVELRFFGGLTIEETAEVLGVSPATVKRDWTVAKAWLRREISQGGPDE